MKINLHPKFVGKQAEKFVKANAPVILTVVGAAGVGVTAYFTGVGTVKAVQVINEAKFYKATEMAKNGEAVTETPTLSKKEVMAKVWKLYIPAVSAGLVSIGAIVMANRINTARLTAAVAAYTLVSQNHEEYKQKVVDMTSKSKEQRVRDELAKDKVAQTPMTTVFSTGRGDTICLDRLGGRYFRGDIESIKKAANDINYRMLIEGHSSLSDFYDKLGLPHTGLSDDLGWTSDSPVDLELTSVLVEDDIEKNNRAVLGAPLGEPVLVMDFRVSPFPGYNGTRCP